MSETGSAYEDIEKWFCCIKKLRKDHSLSQKEMAERLGVSVYTIRKIEKGCLPQRISAAVLIRVYREFSIKPSEQFR